jgi:hypothetical protein
MLPGLCAAPGEMNVARLSALRDAFGAPAAMAEDPATQTVNKAASAASVFFIAFLLI